LSTNAAIFASVLLASRLDTNFDVFGLLSFAVEWFSLFPIFRRHLKVIIFFLRIMLFKNLTDLVKYIYIYIYIGPASHHTDWIHCIDAFELHCLIYPYFQSSGILVHSRLLFPYFCMSLLAHLYSKVQKVSLFICKSKHPVETDIYFIVKYMGRGMKQDPVYKDPDATCIEREQITINCATFKFFFFLFIF
jgi:hypothetical protein